MDGNIKLGENNSIINDFKKENNDWLGLDTKYDWKSIMHYPAFNTPIAIDPSKPTITSKVC